MLEITEYGPANWNVREGSYGDFIAHFKDRSDAELFVAAKEQEVEDAKLPVTAEQIKSMHAATLKHLQDRGLLSNFPESYNAEFVNLKNRTPAEFDVYEKLPDSPWADVVKETLWKHFGDVNHVISLPCVRCNCVPCMCAKVDDSEKLAKLGFRDIEGYDGSEITWADGRVPVSDDPQIWKAEDILEREG